MNQCTLSFLFGYKQWVGPAGEQAFLPKSVGTPSVGVGFWDVIDCRAIEGREKEKSRVHSFF